MSYVLYIRTEGEYYEHMVQYAYTNTVISSTDHSGVPVGLSFRSFIMDSLNSHQQVVKRSGNRSPGTFTSAELMCQETEKTQYVSFALPTHSEMCSILVYWIIYPL